MEVPQQLFVQWFKRREMPERHHPHVRVRQGELCSSKGVQYPLARGVVRRAGGLPFVEVGEGFLGLLQSPSYLRFEQGQQPQRQGQEAGHPHDLVVLPYEQGTEAQREVFDEMEVLFQRPPPSIVHHGLRQRQPLCRCTPVMT